MTSLFYHQSQSILVSLHEKNKHNISTKGEVNTKMNSTALVCSFNVKNKEEFVVCHTLMVLSREPDKKREPSGENSQQ